MAMLAVLAEPLFGVLLSEQWFPAVIYLQLISIAAILYPMHAINLNILKVLGRSDLIMYLSFFKKIIIIIIFLISLRYGIIGILIGQIIGSILSYIPNSYFSAKLINYPVREQLQDFLPCFDAVRFCGHICVWFSYMERLDVHHKAFKYLVLFLFFYIWQVHIFLNLTLIF